MGGKNKPSGSTTTTTSPWSSQQPYLESGFGEAERLYNENTPLYYPYDMVADQLPIQENAITGIESWAYDDNVLRQPAEKQTQAIVRGDYLRDNPAYDFYGDIWSGNSVESDALSPYLSGERLGEGNPYTTALTDSIRTSVVPDIKSDFIAGGSLNNPEAARATAAGVTTALAPYQFDQYQSDSENQLKAAELSGDLRLRGAQGQSGAYTAGMDDILAGLRLAPDIDMMDLTSWNALYNTGAAQQAQNQLETEADIDKWNWEQDLPYSQLNQFQSGIEGSYGGSSTYPYYTNRGAGLLSGIGTGASIGGSTALGLGGWGTLGGGLLGGALSLFSDRRLKTGIKAVGELNNGLTVYAYRYIDDPEDMRRIGLMADEVEDDRPDAVTTLPGSGLKMVDYARAVE